MQPESVSQVIVSIIELFFSSKTNYATMLIQVQVIIHHIGD